jgi:predicted PurR-regulated permease PerM
LDISTGTILRVVIILVGFWFVYLIFDVLLMLFAAVVIASAIRPVANWMERFRVPRALSVIMVYALVLLIISGALTLMIVPLTEQTMQLVRALPSIVERLNLSGFVAMTEEKISNGPVWETVLGEGGALADVGANIVRRTGNVFSAVFTIFFVFFIALYLVVDKDSFKKPFRMVVPKEHLSYTEMVIERAQKKIGQWVVAQIVLAVVIAVVVWLGLWAMGVPYSLVLGILAGVLEIIPILGPIIAAIPAVLIGLTQSLWLGAGLIVFYLLVQQLENNLLIPFLMRKATGLNPIVTILALLLGGRMAGIVGVILAVPAAVVINAFLADLVSVESKKK